MDLNTEMALDEKVIHGLRTLLVHVLSQLIQGANH